MHIEDGLLTNTVWQIATFVGALFFARSLRQLFADQQKGTSLKLMIGALGVFAIQITTMPGDPLLPPHLTGAFALALVMGPALASVCMGTVVALQAILFRDGGVSLIGVNYLNMGVVAPFAAVVLFEVLRRLGKDVAWSAVVALICGMFSQLGVAFAAGLETAIGKAPSLHATVQAMLQGSAIASVMEGLLSAAVYLCLALLMPALLATQFKPEGSATPRRPH